MKGVDSFFYSLFHSHQTWQLVQSYLVACPDSESNDGCNPGQHRERFTMSRFRISYFTILVVLVPLLTLFINVPTKAATYNSTQCHQLPANTDVTLLSQADLDRYGLPTKGNMPLEKWKTIVAGSGEHVCGVKDSGKKHNFQKRISVDKNWSGNYANGSSGPYTEADAVFFVPTVASNSPTGYTAAWVGLGGINNNNLTQAGVDFTKDINRNIIYDAWVENLAATYADNSCGPDVCIVSHQVQPGDRIQVKITQNDMYIGSSNGSGWHAELKYGPNPNNSTAEWIVEDYEPQYWGLDNFGSVTFYGLGDTQANGTYTGPYWQTHDYALQENNAYCGMVYIGPLQYNTVWGPPNDSNTMSYNPNCNWP